MDKKRLRRIILSALIAVAGLFLLQRLLVPKYRSEVVEGRLIAEYYGEEKNHDVIFIGDCEVYENFSPKVLWEEYGINSYIRGSAQQLIWQSCYLLEDTLYYEKPEVVIFNVLAMQYNEPQKEAYNRMTLEGMRWSPAKVKSIRASMTGREEFLDYVFPIMRYHSRWSELAGEDFKYMFPAGEDTVSFNGYYMRVDAKPAKDVPEGKILGDYRFGETAYGYLDEITKMCKENGIELLLIKAPSLYPYWYEEWDAQMREYAEANGLKYINFLDLTDELGIDFETDTYDGGLHMNLSGAEKLSHYLGSYLVRQYGLGDRRGEQELAESWQEKILAYDREKERQYEELEAE